MTIDPLLLHRGVTQPSGIFTERSRFKLLVSFKLYYCKSTGFVLVRMGARHLYKPPSVIPKCTWCASKLPSWGQSLKNIAQLLLGDGHGES